MTLHFDPATTDERARRIVESDPRFEPTDLYRLAEIYHRDREAALKIADQFNACRANGGRGE